MTIHAHACSRIPDVTGLRRGEHLLQSTQNMRCATATAQYRFYEYANMIVWRRDCLGDSAANPPTPRLPVARSHLHAGGLHSTHCIALRTCGTRPSARTFTAPNVQAQMFPRARINSFDCVFEALSLIVSIIRHNPSGHTNMRSAYIIRIRIYTFVCVCDPKHTAQSHRQQTE